MITTMSNYCIPIRRKVMIWPVMLQYMYYNNLCTCSSPWSLEWVLFTGSSITILTFFLLLFTSIIIVSTNAMKITAIMPPTTAQMIMMVASELSSTGKNTIYCIMCKKKKLSITPNMQLAKAKLYIIIIYLCYFHHQCHLHRHLQQKGVLQYYL